MGKRNPFTTPDGYFDQLTTRVMERLPHEEQRSAAKVVRLRPWLYAAIFAGVVAVTATLIFNSTTDDMQTSDGLMATSYNDAYIDDAADYAMVDNQDIYAYLLADM